MRRIVVSLALAAAVAAEGPRPRPLLNVEIVDAQGATSRLAGFHRLSGEDFFQGFLGDAEIEVAYDRVREIRVKAPAHPGGRMRAELVLRTGRVIRAGFDEREGEQLFSGFADYGRVSIYFRDIRALKITGLTKRADLPAYGPPSPGVDLLVKDKQGVATELVGFRRLAGENVIRGVRGATEIAIPMRILETVTLAEDKRSATLAGTATIRSGRIVTFRLPTYEEKTIYRGQAEFGFFRIPLGKVRQIEVHRPTPALRELDPLEAAKGRERPEGARRR